MNNQAQKKQQQTSDEERQLVELLKLNPDILERYPALLAELTIPHASGAAVSLIEKQVTVLRDKLDDADTHMREFMDIARDNERLSMSRHRLAMNLLGARDLDDVISLVKAELGEELGADQVSVRLFATGDSVPDAHDDLFLKRDDARWNMFRTMMKNRLPVCGRSSADQDAFMFGTAADSIRSAAIIPLVAGADLGLIGLGSYDAGRFNTGMGTQFLELTGELVSAALAIHLETAG